MSLPLIQLPQTTTTVRQAETTPSGRQTTKQRNDAVWNSHKSEIEKLYVGEGKTLKEVMSFFEHERNFKWSERYWKDKLKEWELPKYIPASDMSFMARKSEKRKFEEEKESSFSWKGVKLLPDRLTRFKKRKFAKGEEQLTTAPPIPSETPPHIEYHTPPREEYHPNDKPDRNLVFAAIADDIPSNPDDDITQMLPRFIPQTDRASRETNIVILETDREPDGTSDSSSDDSIFSDLLNILEEELDRQPVVEISDLINRLKEDFDVKSKIGISNLLNMLEEELDRQPRISMSNFLIMLNEAFDGQSEIESSNKFGVTYTESLSTDMDLLSLDYSALYP